MKIKNDQIITPRTIYFENFPENKMKLKSNTKTKHTFLAIPAHFYMTPEFNQKQSFTEEVI